MFEILTQVYREWVRLVEYLLVPPEAITAENWTWYGAWWIVGALMIPLLFLALSSLGIWKIRFPIIGRWPSRIVNLTIWWLVTVLVIGNIPAQIIDHGGFTAGIQNYTWTQNVPNPLEFLGDAYRQAAKVARDAGFEVEVPVPEPESEPPVELATEFASMTKVPLRFDRRADGVYAVYVDGNLFVYEELAAPRTPESLVEDLGLAVRQQLLQLDTANETSFNRAWVNLGREVIVLWDSDPALAAAKSSDTYDDVRDLVDRHRQSYNIAETVEGVPPILDAYRTDAIELDQARRSYSALANRYIQAEIAVREARSLEPGEVAARVDDLRANQRQLLAELATLREWAEEADGNCPKPAATEGTDSEANSRSLLDQLLDKQPATPTRALTAEADQSEESAEVTKQSEFCIAAAEIARVEAKITGHLAETRAAALAEEPERSPWSWAQFALRIVAVIVILALLVLAGTYHRAKLQSGWARYNSYRQRQNQQRQQQAAAAAQAQLPQPAQPTAPAQAATPAAPAPTPAQPAQPPTQQPGGGQGRNRQHRGGGRGRRQQLTPQSGTPPPVAPATPRPSLGQRIRGFFRRLRRGKSQLPPQQGGGPNQP